MTTNLQISWWQWLMKWKSGFRVDDSRMDEGELRRLSKVDPGRAKAFLQKEQRRLNQELDDLRELYEDRLSYVAERMAKADNGSLSRDLDNLREAQDSLSRVIQRLRVASFSTQALMHEWQDWEQCDENRQDINEHERALRQELLRSELTLRGIWLESKKHKPTQDEKKADMLPIRIKLPQAPAQTEPLSADFEEFDEVMTPQMENAIIASERTIALLPRIAAHDVGKALEIAKRLRDVHAFLRLHDRTKGTHRFRMLIFEN